MTVVLCCCRAYFFNKNNHHACFFRPGKDGSTSSVFVFGKGFLDLIDDVFWMLPFSSDMQSKRVRQESSITEDVWNARRTAIRADHRLPTARGELQTSWKTRLETMAGSASSGASVAHAIQDGELQYDETED